MPFVIEIVTMTIRTDASARQRQMTLLTPALTEPKDEMGSEVLPFDLISHGAPFPTPNYPRESPSPTRHAPSAPTPPDRLSRESRPHWLSGTRTVALAGTEKSAPRR